MNKNIPACPGFPMAGLKMYLILHKKCDSFPAMYIWSLTTFGLLKTHVP